jgi:hypothetical protein
MRDQAIDQASRYWRLLRDRGANGATDWEASQTLTIQRSSINARRAELTAHGLAIHPAGFRRGPTGVKNTVWVLDRPHPQVAPAADPTCPASRASVPAPETLTRSGPPHEPTRAPAQCEDERHRSRSGSQ